MAIRKDRKPAGQSKRGRVNRRRLLAFGGGAAGLALLACSSRPNGGQPAAGTSRQSGAQNAGPPQPGGTLTGRLPFNPPLDPQKVSGAAQVAVGGVYSRVFRFKTGLDPNVNVDHDLENDLGLSLESPDAVTWTVKLRPDARFHNVAPVNGHPVEAEDIKATFIRALDPAIPNPNRGSLGMIDPAQIQTPAKDTVVFKLAYPYAPFRKTLASPTYCLIFPREVLNGSYDPLKVAIGSGPFMLDSVTPDVAYVYRKNPAWFEQGRPYIDGVRLAVIADNSQAIAQFAGNNLDEFILGSIDDVTAAQQQNPKAVVVKAASGLPNPLYLQLGDPASVFQDVRVRRALSMAIDREAVSKVLFNGEAQQVVFVPAYMGKWSLQVKDLPADTAQYYKYNPAEAKKLLEAAGQSNLQLRLAYLVNSPGTAGPALTIKKAETLANMLSGIGIKMNLITQDYNKDFIDAGKGSRQGYFDKDVLILAGVPSFTEADEFLWGNFHSKSTSPPEKLSDPALDVMLDKARTIVNEDERLKAVVEIQRYLAEKMYVVPTPDTYQWAVTQPRLQNYQFSSTLGKHTETYAKLWLKS